MDSNKSMHVEGSTDEKKAPAFGKADILVAIIGVIAAAMLIVAREPAPAAITTMAQAGMVPATTTARQAPASRTSSAAAPTLRLASNTAPANAPARPAANAPASKAAAVTMTGCVERDDDTFRLKDTDAPKSRSWKSGFLKKSSASIELVDATNRLKLTNHVGRRVSVSGVLVDREMQVRSLHRVAASCN